MRHAVTWRRVAGLAAVAALAMSVIGSGARAANPLAEEKTGVAVGKAAPKFTLDDQTGSPRSLDELVADGPIALVFFRSAGWCPLCMKHLGELNRDRERIEKAGYRLVAISYDDVATLKQFADRVKLAFPLLSDPGSKTIEAYGIRRGDVKPGSREDGVPYPGIFLIDRSGEVRGKLFWEGYFQRPGADDVVRAIEQLDSGSTN